MNSDMDVHQRRKCKRLKGAAAGLKTERSDAASRNPPLTRSTRCCHGERVIGSFELLKEAARIHPCPLFPPRYSLLPRLPLFLPVRPTSFDGASRSSNSRVRAWIHARSPRALKTAVSRKFTGKRN